MGPRDGSVGPRGGEDSAPLTASSRSCTVVYAKDGETILGASNEDWSDPLTRFWIIPGQGRSKGWIKFGFQGGSRVRLLSPMDGAEGVGNSPEIRWQGRRSGSYHVCCELRHSFLLSLILYFRLDRFDSQEVRRRPDPVGSAPYQVRSP